MQAISERWRIFIGYLAESTTYLNQRMFHVYVPEFLPTLTGDISPESITHQIDVENVLTNKKESINFDTTTTILADYFGVLVSRSVPTMYKNQQVLVLNYANNDKFYWLPLERDDALRTFEQIRWSALDTAITNKTAAVGDDVEGKKEGITDDNTYFLEIDTKYHKHIKMQTAASDGEEFRYYFKLDAETKSIELYDKCIKDPTRPPNTISLESEPVAGCHGRIKIETSAGTAIIMEHDCMKIQVPKNLELYVGNNLMTVVQGTTASTFVGPVSTNMMSTYTHFGKDAATLTFENSVGLQIKNMYGITVGANMAVSVVGTYTQQQAVRNVTTLGTDTFTTLNKVSTITGLHTYTTLNRVSTITGLDALTINRANWTINEMNDIFIMDLPEHGHSATSVNVKKIMATGN